MAIAFTIRSIPKQLHHSWKTIASLKSISMRLYILKALRRQIEHDMESLESKTVLNRQKPDEELLL